MVWLLYMWLMKTVFPLRTAAVFGRVTGRAELSSCGRSLSVFPEGEETEEVPSWLRITSNHSSGPALLLLHHLLLPLFQQLLSAPCRGIPCFFIVYECLIMSTPSSSNVLLNNDRYLCALGCKKNSVFWTSVSSAAHTLVMWNLCFATPRSHIAPFSSQTFFLGCLPLQRIQLLRKYGSRRA